MRFYDTHAHYRRGFVSKRHRDFHERVTEILKEAYQAGVTKIMNVGLDPLLSEYIVHDFANYPWNEAANEMPEMYFAVGEHPKSVKNEIFSRQDKEDEKNMMDLCKNKKVRAIKTGLDHSVEMHRWERQEKRFRDWIRVSKKMQLPLILHIRDAFPDALTILDEEAEGKTYKGVVHCFTGDSETAKQFIERGFLIGIGGKVTDEDNYELRETVKTIPLKSMVLETDCPYVRVKNGPKVSTSADLTVIAKTVVDLRNQGEGGVSLEEVGEIFYENSESLFG